MTAAPTTESSGSVEALYVDRPFADRPYGRIRLNEGSLYDLHAVVDEWLWFARESFAKAQEGGDELAIRRLLRMIRRMERVQESLCLLADEKGWNIPV